MTLDEAAEFLKDFDLSDHINELLQCLARDVNRGGHDAQIKFMVEMGGGDWVITLAENQNLENPEDLIPVTLFSDEDKDEPLH